ncbi:MAG: acetylxylan esterase [Pirellulales bacterium]
MVFSNEYGDHTANLLIYLPNNVEPPVPTFLTLNFLGNHTIDDDPEVIIPSSWVRAGEDYGVTQHRANERGRGVAKPRWPIRHILERGYGVAALYYGDIEPDHDGGFVQGVRRLFHQGGQSQPAVDEWGAIAAWAWGCSRALDYFQTDDGIDHTRVAVMGHSRLGKTALWAGASDPRFALVISNNSGCGGAALSRRRYGETVSIINHNFINWFADRFNDYIDHENDLPVDQHEVMALVAPRPLYVASAVEDRWADPRGEFLAAQAASPVYELLGVAGLPADAMPEIDHPVTGTIGYHVRTGKHDVTPYDWEQYLDFADRHLKGRRDDSAPAGTGSTQDQPPQNGAQPGDAEPSPAAATNTDQ